MSIIYPIGAGQAGSTPRIDLGSAQPAVLTDLGQAAAAGRPGASGLSDVNSLVGEFLKNLGLENNQNLKLLLGFLVLLALIEGQQGQSSNDQSGEQLLAGLGRLAVAVGLASSPSSGTAIDSQQAANLTVVSQRIEWTSISATWSSGSFDSYA